MITVLQSADRDQSPAETGEHSSAPSGRTVAKSSRFRGLAHLSEEHAPLGHPFSGRTDEGSEAVLYVRTGTVIIQQPQHAIRLPEGAFIHQPAGRRSNIQMHNTTATVAHMFTISLLQPAPSASALVTWRWLSESQRSSALRPVASRDGRLGSLALSHETVIYSAVLRAGRHIVHQIAPGRSVWLHIVVGRGNLCGQELSTGDGAGMVDERAMSFTPSEDTEVLVIDLP